MTAGTIPLTTIVMVSYYTGPVLFDALTAILASPSALEICLVDNGNPPEVVSRIQSIAKSEARLKVVTGHGNVGFSRACNMGAKNGRGEYLLFLNPDSKPSVDFLTRLYAHAQYLKHPFMIGARLLNENGKDQRGCRRALLTPRTAFLEATGLFHFFPKHRLNYHEENVPQQLTEIPAISGAFMYLPSHDFWAIGGFDEDYFLHVEDLDLCWRFRQLGGTIYFAPDVIVTHIGGTSRATKAFIEKNKAQGFVRYFEKNFGNNTLKPLLWLLEVAIWLRAYIKILRTSLYREV